MKVTKSNSKMVLCNTFREEKKKYLGLDAPLRGFWGKCDLARMSSNCLRGKPAEVF
jgi:hypothetical protein